MILGAKSRGIGAVQCWPPRGWGSIPRSRSSTIPRPMRASQTSGGWGQTKCPWGCSTPSSSSIASTSGAWTSSRRRSDSCSTAVTQRPRELCMLMLQQVSCVRWLQMLQNTVSGITVIPHWGSFTHSTYYSFKILSSIHPLSVQSPYTYSLNSIYSPVCPSIWNKIVFFHPWYYI